MQQYERLNRIREALQLRGMKQIELCERTGISRGTLTNWISQRWQPKQESLMKLAKALNVSEMWLAGYDVPMERPLAQIKNDELAQLINEIRKNEALKDLFISISHLNADQRQLVLNMVKELTKINPYH